MKCQEDDVYSEEVGLALCFAKKALGNKSNFNNVFKKWISEEEEEPPTIAMTGIGVNAQSAANALDGLKKLFSRPRGVEEI